MPDEVKPEGKAQPPAGGTAAPKPPAPKAPPAPKPPVPTTMVTSPWDGEIPGRLKEQFRDQVVECASYLGQNFVVARPAAVIPILDYLKLELDFDYMVDLTVVDWPKKPERFEVVWILYSFARNERVRVKTAIAAGAKAGSAVALYPTANWLEREAYDMFGVEFNGHPDLRRILLPDEWEGFPLRKDYGITQMDNRWVQENLGIESGQ